MTFTLRLLRPFRAPRLGSFCPRAVLRSALGWYLAAPSGQNSGVRLDCVNLRFQPANMSAGVAVGGLETWPTSSMASICSSKPSR